jgi:hypothetical protein
MPTLNERRAADHFIKPAGIAGVYADARGARSAPSTSSASNAIVAWLYFAVRPADNG